MKGVWTGGTTVDLLSERVILNFNTQIFPARPVSRGRQWFDIESVSCTQTVIETKNVKTPGVYI